MAWESHGTDNDSLVSALKANGLITSGRVEAAMRAIDRGNYCPRNAYQDSPQTLGHGATISAPHMHAHCLQQTVLHLHEGASVLDVGSGSGYLCAVFAELVGPTGRVVGIDHIPELVEASIQNVNKADSHLLSTRQLCLVTGDGRQGWVDGAPYDVIHVGAAAAVLPKALIAQLKCGGRMVIPVGPAKGRQTLDQYDKGVDGSLEKTSLMGVRYVPLTSRDDPHYS